MRRVKWGWISFLLVGLVRCVWGDAVRIPCTPDVPALRGKFDRIEVSCFPDTSARQFDLYIRGSTHEFLSMRYRFAESGDPLFVQSFSSEGKVITHEQFESAGADRYWITSLNSERPEALIRDRHLVRFNRETLQNEHLGSEILRRSEGEYRRWIVDRFDLASGSAHDIVERQIFSSRPTPDISYHLHYRKISLGLKMVDAMEVREGDGRVLGRYRFQSSDERSEIERIRQELIRQRANHKIPIVMIDSGFDTGNPQLLERMAMPVDEPIDGIDNDGDGFVDNAFGVLRLGQPRVETGLVQSLPVFKGSSLESPVPVDHGTHVGDLMTRGLRRHGLYVFAGDMAQESYLGRISLWLTRHQVLFANLSFDFGMPGEESGIAQAPLAALTGLYRMIQENPQTLFFVAAGNRSERGHPFDLDTNPSWPASIESSNKVVVAAVNVAELKDEELWNYQLAEFSSVGEKTVDIAMAGQQVVAWNVANHKIPLSGTSMSSPLVANIGVKVKEANPNLSNSQIKEILMKTAYVYDLKKPLQVRSGGIAIERRAIRAAQLMVEDERLSVEASCLKAHEQMPLPLELNGATLAELKAFWRSRQL